MTMKTPGSLNYGIDDAPGNALVYDCITALDWVQKYIHHFGGDKDRVTMSGNMKQVFVFLNLMNLLSIIL
jgi:hypothetical protein